MSRHNETGSKGEGLALAYFLEKGYTILEQNWRTGRLEVDIIAVKNGLLHFIEVKTRTSMLFGYPEENVSKKKINNLINASEIYLQQYPQWQRIQFDVLAIQVTANNKTPEFFLIEDVYL